jgi:hypothetical protein
VAVVACHIKKQKTTIMKVTILTLSGFLYFFQIAYSQTKNPTAEQQLLSVFKGHWTIEGSESSYLEICDFIEGNHIQCISTSKEKEGIDSSVSYLTYSSTEKTYIYYGLYGSGSSRTLKGNWVTDKFILEGQRLTAEKKTKWKVTITPVNKDLHFVQEVSVNEGPWEKNADFMYKRVQ